jgi:leucine efflux protein
MLGIADFGAFCAAIVVFLALPGPGTFALLGATGQGGFKAALMAATPWLFNAVRWAGAAYLAWIGFKLLIAKDGEDASPVRIAPSHYFRQAMLITLLNPKAIVFYMAFFPLFIDPATHRGLPTFAAMAVTIAVITAIWCLTLCAFAERIAGHVRAHRRLAKLLQRGAGICLIGFGLRMVR